MAEKVVINLATGLEDAERVTVAFVAGAALDAGKPVAMFLTKEAVRLRLPRIAVRGRPCRQRGPAAGAALRAVRREGRRTPRLPDLLQRAQAQRIRAGQQRQTRGRNATLGLDRRKGNRLQLLTRTSSNNSRAGKRCRAPVPATQETGTGLDRVVAMVRRRVPANWSPLLAVPARSVAVRDSRRRS